MNITSLKLLNDFKITIYENSTHISQPRSMDHIIYNNNLILYVGSKHESSILYALIDTNGDLINDHSITAYSAADSELNIVTIDPITNYVYLATQKEMHVCYNLHEYVVSQINAKKYISRHCELFIEFAGNISSLTHARHYAQFSPNGDDLCIAFGSDCDLCDDPTPPRTTIRCYNMSAIRHEMMNHEIKLPIKYDDVNSRIIAYGVRNCIGFDWNPTTNKLYFTDNGANDIDTAQLFEPKSDKWITYAPDDELNFIATEGSHYGYPYQHSVGTGNPYLRDINSVNTITDQQFGNYNQFNNNHSYTLPIQSLGPHVAALGMKFYDRNSLMKQSCEQSTTSDNKYSLFPQKYDNAIFIALHGSWDHYGLASGYKIVVVVLDKDDNTKINSFENFITGWRMEGHSTTVLSQNISGRPAFVQVLYDGSLLISDDYSSNIYRVSYVGADAKSYQCSTKSIPDTVIIGIIIVALVVTIGGSVCIFLKLKRTCPPRQMKNENIELHSFEFELNEESIQHTN